MITRVWHGRTSLRDAGNYLDFLLNAGTREYRETPGHLSVKVWKREEKDSCHFYTVTEWEDLDAVKRFTEIGRVRRRVRTRLILEAPTVRWEARG
jgi:heme-degrading monooxygenase HmoA